MGGASYDSLCFRHTVMSRPTGQLAFGPDGPSKALEEAEEADHGQVLSFFRLLDENDDAHVTLQSFCKAVMHRPGGKWALARRAFLTELPGRSAVKAPPSDT